MKCSHCGKENLDKSKFCKGCGKPLQNPIQSAEKEQNDYQPGIPVTPPEMQSQSFNRNTGTESQPSFSQQSIPQFNPQFSNTNAQTQQTSKVNKVKKKSFSKPALLFTIALIAVVVTVAVVFIIPRFSNTNTKKQSQHPQYTWLFPYNEKRDESYIVMNADLQEEGLDGRVRNRVSNQDGSVTVVLTSENILYYVTPTELFEISDDMDPDNYSSFVISPRSNKVAYVDDDHVLFIYSAEDGKSEEIADDVISASLAISQDGGSVAYTVYEDKDNVWDMELFVWRNGQSESVGENLLCISVSNDAKYIYSFLSEDGKKPALYFSSYGSDKKRVSTDISSTLDQSGIFYMNETQSEILFHSGEDAYISKSGDKPIKIGNSEMMYPIWSDERVELISGNSNAQIVLWPTLLENVYLFYDYDSDTIDISYVDETGGVESIIKKADSQYPQININRDTLFYIRKEKLYRTAVKNQKKADLVADDVSSFRILPDGKSIYFIDTDNVLWYQSGNNEPKEVMDDVWSIQLNVKDNTLFIQADRDTSAYLSTLYFCRDGEKPERIEKRISSLQISMQANYYYVQSKKDDSYELFTSPGSTDFESILDDLDRIFY